MKKTAFRLACGALALWALSCSDGGGDGGGGGGGTVISGGIITGHVGTVQSPDTGVGGVTIQIGARQTTTNEQGWYALAEVPANARAVVVARREGYVDGIEPVTVQDGSNVHVDIILVPVGTTRTLPAATGGTVSTQGATVTVPAGAFVAANGGAISGDVSLSLSPIDPTTAGGYRAFPGDFTAVTRSGAETLLETYSLMDVTARQGAQALQLAPGATLDVQFPIPAAALATAPSTIELWSLDPTSGRWREEGTATREASTAAPSGAVYRAQLPHLSTWNCDVSFLNNTTCIRGCVISVSDQRPVPRALVRAVGVDYRGESTATTGADGCFAVNVRRSARVRVLASAGTVVSEPREVTTPDATLNTSNGAATCADIGSVPVGEPLAQLVLTWGARPSDLDSHLTGPQSSGARFHVYYGNKGSIAAAPWAELDTDDTSSYGPEVITLTRVQNGRYRYAIHNYSGQSAGAIEASGASVYVIVPRLGVVRRYTPPSVNPAGGNVWRVMDLVVENGGVSRVEGLNDYVATTSSSGTAFNP